MTAALRNVGSIYLAHLIFAQSVAAVSTCCYSDACNGDTICAAPGATLVDSCGVRYTVTRPGCVLKRQPCCFIDACNSSVTLCAAPGDTLADSCGRAYRVSRSRPGSPSCQLSLLRRCCYRDACLAKSNTGSAKNKDLICALRSYTFTDSCGVTYRVGDNRCTLRRVNLSSPSSSSKSVGRGKVQSSLRDKFTCCYSDACNGKRICARRTGGSGGGGAVRNKVNTLTDSCGRSYMVADNCSLSFLANRDGKSGATGGDDKCCFRDACTPQKTICAPRGAVLPDSCGRAYVVSTVTCALAALQCCAVDQCPRRSGTRLKGMMTRETRSKSKDSSSPSRTVCSRIEFSTAFAASLLAKHDLFCTGFKATFQQCAARRDRLAVAAAGVERIVRDSLAGLFQGKRNVQVQATVVHDGSKGVTVRPLQGSETGGSRGRMWSVGVRLSRECIGKRCAIRLMIKTRKMEREETVGLAIGSLLKRPDWDNVFQSGCNVAVKRKGRRDGWFIYLLILNFNDRFAAEFR